MPIAPPNTRGYSDWQRINNWDSGDIYSANNAAVNGTIDSAVFDVSRYAYIGGSMLATGNPGIIAFLWYLDPAGTILVAQRNFTLGITESYSAQLRVPNLAPFLKIELSTLTGFGAWALTANLFGTNRYHPCELIPPLAYVLQRSLFVGAGATVTFDSQSYFSGPCRLLGEFDTGQYVITLRSRSIAGAVVDHDVSGNETQTPFEYNLIAPFSHWWLSANNFSGVGGQLTLTVTPSLTGST